MTTAYDIPYMLRTREYYRAQGYESDYAWAHFSTTPMQRPLKPLDEATVSVITTAMPDTDTGWHTRQVYVTPCSPVPESMYTKELSWDKQATHTDDVGSFLPLKVLHELENERVIGALNPHFYSLPTEFSQRNTREKDAPAILKLCQAANSEIALLIPL